MNNLFWKLFAKFLAIPAVADWIINDMTKQGHFNLTGYMDRSWVTPRWMLTYDEAGDLTPKWWVPFIFAVRLHHTKRPDREPHKHDHPRDNRSVVLKGWVEEMDIFNNSLRIYPGATVFRRAEVFHKLVAVPVGGVWTLWFVGRKRQKWGFLVDGRKVYWKNYFAMKVDHDS